MSAMLPRRRHWTACYYMTRDDAWQCRQWLTMTDRQTRRDFWRRSQCRFMP